jgi:hypothetical protein
MTFHELRQRADQVRTIALETVLSATGAQQDRRDKAKWHTPRGTLSVTGAKFMNWNQGVGGGGAIDLAMHLEGMGFKAAVQWLWNLSPGSLPTRDLPWCQKPTLRLPEKHPANLARVVRYLTVDRRLPPSSVKPLIEAGSIYADSYGNAVFLLLGKGKAPVGAELRGTGLRPWKGMAPGSRKDDGYFSVNLDAPQRLILCESAIDAISCAVLNPGAGCISTAGVTPSPAWIHTLLCFGCPVFCGFDADPPGDQAARNMTTLHPAIARYRPGLQDWNEMLMVRK